MSDFELKAEPLISAADLAKRWGATPQTVGNYARAGMPVAGHGARGMMMFDAAVCEKWKAEHRPPGRGGRRLGAGRKSDAERPPTEETEQLVKEASDAKLAGVIGDIDISSGTSILESYKPGAKITPSGAKVAREMMETAVKRITYDQQRGTLVDREATRGLVVRHLRAVRMVLDALPARTARAVEERGLDRVQAQAVREAVQAEVDAALEMLSQDPLGESAAKVAA